MYFALRKKKKKRQNFAVQVWFYQHLCFSGRNPIITFLLLLRPVEFLMVVKTNTNTVMKLYEFASYKSSVVVYITASEATKGFK